MLGGVEKTVGGFNPPNLPPRQFKHCFSRFATTLPLLFLSPNFFLPMQDAAVLGYSGTPRSKTATTIIQATLKGKAFKSNA